MFNKAILMGRLTRDPEQSTSPSGVVVTRFTLAVDRRFQRQGEEKQTDFLLLTKQLSLLKNIV